jgi:hypothetical protein
MFFYFIYDWRLQKEETPSKIRHIPGDLWNEVKNILPAEKPIETIGRPIVPLKST